MEYMCNFYDFNFHNTREFQLFCVFITPLSIMFLYMLQAEIGPWDMC